MNIKTFTVLPLAVIFGIVVAVVIAATTQSVATAHAAASSTKNQKKTEGQKEVSYSYVAQPSDSYSKVARKAIQTYGLKNKVKLSKSQIIYAETNLTQEADSPQLLQGQKVEIKESAVKSWVVKAKDLKKDQLAKWDKYTIGVNFNTDNVGESH